MNVESQIMPYKAVTRLGEGPALVLAPHPDDEVLGCAGAIMRHLEAGDPVRVIVLTDGGGWLAAADAPRRAAYIARRREESRAAARILGYGEPLFWDYRDRELPCDESLAQRLVGACREFGTHWLYAPSLVEMHPDHRALALTAVEAVRRIGAPVRLAMYEIGIPLSPNRLLDISNLVERKQRAIQCFASQLAEQDYDRHIEALNRYRTYTLPRTVQAAEAYWVVAGGAVPHKVIDPARRRRYLQWAIEGFQDEDDFARDENDATREPECAEQDWRARYAAIVASRSWRLTEPLRRVGRYWRALARCSRPS
ncbi:MAG: PIG-L family deacetylase [Gammaproteobacteria bacterium]|nr:PIG-L family deacetylase [Gammaproteobacteria bacterium]